MISTVAETDMEAIDRILTNQDKSVSGTLKSHQITGVASNPMRIYLRKFTCLSCEPGSICYHDSLSKGFIDLFSNPIAAYITQSQEILRSKQNNIIAQPLINEKSRTCRRTDEPL